MKLRGLKKVGMKPEKVKTKSGNVLETGEKVAVFRTPDGYKGTYKQIMNEVERGRLHGCIVCSS